MLQDALQAADRAHPSTGETEIPKLQASLESAPEADEGPEGKRKEDSIFIFYADPSIDLFPAVQEPLPALPRIQPIDRLPRGARGPVDPRIVTRGAGQICPVGRIFSLVPLELFFLGKRQLFK